MFVVHFRRTRGNFIASNHQQLSVYQNKHNASFDTTSECVFVRMLLDIDETKRSPNIR